MVGAEVLKFGDFVAKSGRKTPYFVNSGSYRTGQQLRQLAAFYVDAIETRGVQFDVLFGPAYKGIPLVVARPVGDEADEPLARADPLIGAQLVQDAADLLHDLQIRPLVPAADAVRLPGRAALQQGVGGFERMFAIKVLHAEMDNFSNDFLNIVKRHFFK